jgi:uncharacterized membrane protein YjjP (DUF1212 family)
MARSSPDCDPWAVALAWPGRRPRRKSRGLHVRPLVVALAVVLSGTATMLSGLGVVGAVLAAFAGYCSCLLADFLVARHRRRHSDVAPE